MYGNENYSENMTKEEKFEYYELWGKHLSILIDDDKFINGSPLNKTGYSLSKENLCELGQENSILEGFMIIKADNVQELESKLKKNPVLETTNAAIHKHKFDPRALISVR